MQTVIVLKKADFMKNTVGRFLWDFLSSSSTYKEDKKIIIDTRHRWKDAGPIWTVFNSVLQQLRKEGTTKIIIR